MSWHMKLKLPSFKLTRRCGDSAVEQNVSRGIASQTSVQESPVAGSEYEEDGAFGVNDISESEDFQAVPEPSLHAIKQKSTVLAWEGVRAALRTAAVQCSAMPIGQECILCSELAEYRCLECAAWAFYCSECFGNVHSKVGIFHTGEIWQV